MSVHSVEDMQRIIRENFGDWAFLEDYAEMSNNELGPRVTGGSVYKPVKPTFASPAEIRVKKAKEARKKSKPYNGGHVDVEYEVATRKATGFNIHLEREGKTIFMPIREAEPDLAMIDLMLLGDDPELFAVKHGWAMIDAARQRLRKGTVGTPDELNEYRGESWMSGEQIQVLIDLRGERG